MEIKRLADLAVGVIGFIWVFVMCLFLDVSGVIRRVTLARTVVRSSRQGYVSFNVRHSILSPIFL